MTWIGSFTTIHGDAFSSSNEQDFKIVYFRQIDYLLEPYVEVCSCLIITLYFKMFSREGFSLVSM